MRYCTMTDLTMAIPLQTLKQLSNDDACGDEINHAVVEAAMAQAEETVDGYLRGRYILPITPVPTLVKQYTIALARHWMYARRPEGSDLPDAVRATYKDAIKALETIRDGKLHLGVVVTGVDTASSGEFRARTRDKMFDHSVLSKY